MAVSLLTGWWQLLSVPKKILQEKPQNQKKVSQLNYTLFQNVKMNQISPGRCVTVKGAV